jgi:hypothetical protein
MESKFGCKNVNSDFSIISQPFHTKQIAVDSAVKDLSKTTHNLANRGGRITYLFLKKNENSVVWSDIS